MPIQTRYLFTAAMDVEPTREALFNEAWSPRRASSGRS